VSIVFSLDDGFKLAGRPRSVVTGIDWQAMTGTFPPHYALVMWRTGAKSECPKAQASPKRESGIRHLASGNRYEISGLADIAAA
jgi:hypothetical protein